MAEPQPSPPQMDRSAILAIGASATVGGLLVLVPLLVFAMIVADVASDAGADVRDVPEAPAGEPHIPDRAALVRQGETILESARAYREEHGVWPKNGDSLGGLPDTPNGYEWHLWGDELGLTVEAWDLEAQLCLGHYSGHPGEWVASVIP